jgi:hypothetical protein
VYNSYQLSDEVAIMHLDTARSLRNTWVVNKFRDLKQNPNVKIINNNFSINEADLDLNTPWYQQKRFVDNSVSIRLIFENDDDYLLILHSANANTKKSYR